jgi:hypothetical protein
MVLQGWWNAFRSWAATFDWGNVPTRIGSLLTSISVLIAISILRNDRRLRRRKSADNFNTWTGEHMARPFEPPFRRVFRINAYNSGDVPISYARIWLRDGDYARQISLASDPSRLSIGPKEDAESS